MTLQDDRTRTWFQPMVPTEQPHRDAAGDAGPLTTRIEGELVFPEQPPAPAPWAERLEVTQPFIPAIREQTPEFAKRLTAEPVEPVSPEPHPPDDTPTVAATPVGEPQSPPPRETATQSQDAASDSEATPPKKRRSLARRVVRRILGPDLLRKDPAPKKR
ncbi:hypothetical protein SAMN04487905_10336 [Actinopolyspora xinjiangensis]|uniref:Uncharacterized protein n=2 Tax=Actinopolyspora xinjiangensis TaxID=405564 RepID=A0A1H0RES3_9ACTN|nr:hypothetical protein SAMN04487905_10336 [Actinopolyspora xinjiangensis]